MRVTPDKAPSIKKVWILACAAFLLSLFFAQSSRMSVNAWLSAQPLAQALNGGWQISGESGVLHENAAFCVSGSLKTEPHIMLTNTLPATDNDNISFVTIGYQVSAEIDGKRIYTFGSALDDWDVWGVKTHLVQIPDGAPGRIITLDFHTCDSRSVAVSADILLDNGESIINTMLKTNVYAIILSFSFIVVGFFSMLFSFISMLLKRRRRYVPLVALSAIAVLMGSSVFFNLAVVAYYVGPSVVHWVIGIINLALPLMTLLFVMADSTFNKPLLVAAALQGMFLCLWTVCNLLHVNFFLLDWHWVLTVMTVLVLTAVFIREFRSGKGQPDLAVAIAIIFTMSGLDAISYYTHGSYNAMDFYLMIGTLPVLMLMTGRTALRFVQEEHRILNENATLRIEGDLLYKNYVQTEKYIEETRLIWHDIDKHFSVIGRLTQSGDYNELQHYLSKIGHDIRIAKDYLLCDNKLVNSILTDKLTDAKRHGISVSCAGNLPNKLHIQGNDLCSLLVNIIDNAIEACLKLTSGQERRIDMTLAYKNGFAYIHVANSSAGMPRIEGEKFLTNKSDKFGHGLGISIIRRIVAKYHGALDIVPSESSFLVVAALKDEAID